MVESVEIEQQVAALKQQVNELLRQKEVNELLRR
jgi:hypothetical protein